MVVDLLAGTTGIRHCRGCLQWNSRSGHTTAANLTGPLVGNGVQDLIAGFTQAGGGAHVEVDTAAHPQGEIRGDIVPPGPDATAPRRCPGIRACRFHVPVDSTAAGDSRLAADSPSEGAEGAEAGHRDFSM
ncbi:MAG: hypothetical protein M1274_08435 [Actinobacteria bacterium]|nr:hypothetical protein [Actinomycetota bacterium]